MGAADLVPGISGGTLAFVFGIYERLIDNLTRFKMGGKRPEWSFVVPLAVGMLSALILFSNGIRLALQSPLGRSYLLAAFFGLILASLFFCLGQIQKRTPWVIYCFAMALATSCLMGTFGKKQDGPFAVSYSESRLPEGTFANYENGRLTGLREEVVGQLYAKGLLDKASTIYKNGALTNEIPQTGTFRLWLVAAGFMGASAMLLPGISGSYILLLMGAYEDVLGALATLARGHLELDATLTLTQLAVGITLGFFLMARFIRYFLKQYPNETVAALCGLMLGGLPVLWPFWSYRTLFDPLKERIILDPLQMQWPDTFEGAVALGIALSTFGLLFSFTPKFLKSPRPDVEGSGCQR